VAETPEAPARGPGGHVVSGAAAAGRSKAARSTAASEQTRVMW
jgi:hypothetical protein